jgi:hypothetical protein
LRLPLTELVVIAIGALLLLPSSSNSKPTARRGEVSAVYCIRDKAPPSHAGDEPGAKLFALKALGYHHLKFGLDFSDANGQMISIYGIAQRSVQNVWIYRSEMTDPYAKCEISIRRTLRGAIVSSNPKAPCKGYGGYGTQIGVVNFTHRYFEKPVTFELDSRETFYSARTAPRC